jgi:chromate transporter
VLLVSLRLGVSSFGGPVAHLGYFRDEYVTRRAWVSDEGFADIVALCQSLPGPASSQVNMAIGMARAGLPGALAAWIGFTLPSAVALTAFAFVAGTGGLIDSGWMHGIMLAAVAVVAQALVAMARRLTPDTPRVLFAVTAAIVSLLVPASLAQLAIIVAGGVAGRLLLPSDSAVRGEYLHIAIPRSVSIGALTLFVLFLIGLPVLRQLVPTHWISLVESYYRVGSLVFGGGHVVLPLLHAETVPSGWVSDPQFLAGYGAAQAMPGPLFTFAAYLGAIEGPTPNGIPGALLALGAIFLPSFLLLVGVLPFWASLRARPGFQSVLAGVNAAVVGLLVAALYAPVWSGAVRTPEDFCIALACFSLLAVKKVRPWMVVGLGAAAGAALRLLS